MNKVAATPVSKIISSDCTEDGAYGLITLQNNDGTDFTLALQPKQLEELMLVSGKAWGAAVSKQNDQKDVKHMYPVEGYNLRHTDDGESLIVGFRLLGGMELYHRFEKIIGQGLRDSLSVALDSLSVAQGKLPDPKDEKTK